MKILFICGSAEPGKDGVGDYTRRLSGELLRQGHLCVIVAIMDNGVNSILEEIQEIDLTSVSVLRMPFYKGYQLNCLQAKPWIEDFNPDWISIQYVPFSFHPKGLPFGFGKTLKQLTKGRKVHLMFHELWVGMEKESSIKTILWGFLQKIILKRMYKLLGPCQVHTQTIFYQLLLKKHKIVTNILPLFSNIPCKPDKSFFEDRLKNLERNEIHFILFGTLHSCDNIELFLNTVNSYQEKSSKLAVIKAVGRNGIEVNRWKEFCEKLGIKFEISGELDSQVIANILASSNIGITTTALPMIQKSGTVASMCEFGIPIICINHQWKPREIDYKSIPYGINVFQERIIDICLSSNGNSDLFPGLYNVANIFITSLKSF